MRVLIGCERFGKVRDAFRRRGHDAWSCDIAPDVAGSPFHLHGDVRHFLEGRPVPTLMGWKVKPWDLAIFHPDCTYLTNSAEWAYKDGPYHQKDDAQRALNDYNHIRAALDGMVMVCGRTGNAFEDFEEQAAVYQTETGRMRPGKDRPMTSDDRDDDREASQKNFSAWVQSKIQAGRDALMNAPVGTVQLSGGDK